ncbi:TonB-dependent receptor plug domain-containing protein [Paraglaciecola sp.]|uniref:TonB-dependent receptor plug domain-containing protein n=1 Tax=Paraglaciecola sp. TaxID=1920173 RepID=UPI003EF91525
MKLKQLTVCVVAAGLSFSSKAEQLDMFSLSLEELLEVRVVTAASGYEQPLKDSPASVSVIYQEEWQASGARELNDVLANVAGIHIKKRAIGITTNIPVIRGVSGSEGQQILVLIDGSPFKYLQNSGSFLGNRLLLAGFSRIEIIRGPGSAIYGADALGGIINLVSKKQVNKKVHLRTGSFDSFDAGFSHSGEFTDGSWSVSFEHQRSNDDPNKVVSSDLQSTFDEIFGTQASLAPGRINEHYKVDQLNAIVNWKKLTLQAFHWSNSDLGLGAGVAQALDPTGTGSSKNTQYKITYSILEGNAHNLTAKLEHSDQTSRTFLHVFPAGSVFPIGIDGNIDFVNPNGLVSFPDGYIGAPGNEGSQSSINLTYLNTQFNNHHIRVDVGTQRTHFRPKERKNFGPSVIDGTEGVVDGTLTDVSFTPYAYLPHLDQNLTHISFEDQWQITPKWRATIGGRVDQYSDIGDTFNPRLGLSWSLNENTQLKLFYGSAFRAPSFVELYSQNNPAAIGNPDLKPEKVNIGELGINLNMQLTPEAFLSFSMYRSKLRDLIEHRETIGGIQQSVNIGEQTNWGAEMNANWKPMPSLKVSGHLSYLHAEDQAGVDIANIPTQMAYVEANWKINQNWQFFVNHKWINERKRAEGDNRPNLPGYNWLNTKVSWQQQNLTLSLLANNLADKQAKEPSNGSIADDLPLHGRMMMLELGLEY